MNIIVLVKHVPDLVEELIINNRGKGFDLDYLRFKLNEFDDHAIEEAILLKERYTGEVTVIALEGEGVEDTLFTASAKGSDRLIKLTAETANGSGIINNHALARALVPLIRELHPTLILTGVQAHNDLDGPLGPLVAEYLGVPYLGYVSGVNIDNGKATIRKEFPGGLIAEMAICTPSVLGIQAAENPPRYVAFSKIRQAAKTTTIEERSEPASPLITGPFVDRMYQLESTEKAEMISGDVEVVADRLVSIFIELGVL
jgi:electron transfer flavoprotein beta subunit